MHVPPTVVPRRRRTRWVALGVGVVLVVQTALTLRFLHARKAYDAARVAPPTESITPASVTAIPVTLPAPGPAVEDPSPRPAAPGPPPTTTVPDDATLTLERSVCYGYCPAYVVTVQATGKVDYEGKAFVKVQGKRSDTVDPARARALVQRAADALFAMKEAYVLGVTDNPTAYVTVKVGGRTKRIRDYPPCHRYEGAHHAEETPSALCAIETDVDALAATAPLVQCESDGGPTYCTH